MALRLLPPRPRETRLRSDGPLCVAHRGASHRAPENTMVAIEHALRVGADVVEVDVRRTRDGALVLMHDTGLVRTTDIVTVYPHRGPWRVDDFTLAELQRLDAGSWKSKRYAGEQVPELRDALRAVHRAGARLLVEVKSPELYPGIVEDILALLAEPESNGGVHLPQPVTVQSFDFAAMETLKSLSPRVPVGLLGAPPVRQLPELACWADQVNPHHGRIDRPYVELLHDLGLRCQAWTVDSAGDMRRLLQLGVDGVITNRPAKLIRHLPGRVAPLPR